MAPAETIQQIFTFQGTGATAYTTVKKDQVAEDQKNSLGKEKSGPCLRTKEAVTVGKGA